MQQQRMDMSNILTIFVVINIFSLVQAADKYADCKITHTLGYGYKNIYHISESGNHQNDTIFTFKFLVKAISDAHILLSSTPSPSSTDLVYEIVIGAGKNTFSDIRRQVRAQSKAKVPTLDYLSDSEYRGFWITIDKTGLIQVGKADENIPFIFWTDPQPLLIRYFSFCTWGSVVGRWLYSCPNDTKSEEVDVPKMLTPTEQLRQDLLQNYDPYSRPILDENDITNIFIHLNCQNVKLDEEKSVLSVRAAVTMHWEDQKLQWKPQDYDNISLLTVLHHEVWQPELVLYNAADHGTDMLTDTPLLVSSLGLIMWKSQASMDVRCSLDLSKWPYDQQTCELQLGFWAQHEVLHLDLIGKGTKFDEAQHPNSEWNILSLEANSSKLKTPWINTTSDLKDNKALSIQLSLQRRGHGYMIVLAVPLIAFGTLTLLAFWISPLDSNRILLSCINLILMSILLLGLGKILPAAADKAPVILLSYSHGMIAITFSLLISVMVIGFTRYNHIYPLPGRLCIIITNRILQFVLCLPSIYKQKSTSYKHLREMNGDRDEGSSQDDRSTVNLRKIQQEWILLATVIDRLVFIIYIMYIITLLFNYG